MAVEYLIMNKILRLLNINLDQDLKVEYEINTRIIINAYLPPLF
jgi:hypothetical protein